ncbi:hypothetical protein [Dyadobacter frigoris]|uniref:DUF4332 domain-containing protein n=1 Tax=Dyadobacter frigoris TaxID=2576211 RepID=A0A4U6D8V2_9BACT|nr:hypothetical protein [Dyadobacter frigoris]TKT92697.1 hypothetical protein FDK13_07765 [Dyadobacter frigoris]GLU51589.1 hypothetical protein Dfri01_10500 [Dyadobacter frigoris]
MMLLQLNPFSKPVAISEILILLIIAAFVGWLIARLITNGRIRVLRESISERKIELANCRSQHREFTTAQQPLVGKASKTVYPTAIPLDPAKADDFKIIEGIGPKIEELINKEGIYTYEQLSNTNPIRISNILKNAGPRFQMHDPSSWPQQAKLANEKRWQELQILKDKLIAGRQ